MTKAPDLTKLNTNELVALNQSLMVERDSLKQQQQLVNNQINERVANTTLANLNQTQRDALIKGIAATSGGVANGS